MYIRGLIIALTGALLVSLVTRAHADIAWAYDDPDDAYWNYSGHAVQAPDCLTTGQDPFGSAGSIPLTTSYAVEGNDSIKLEYHHEEGGYWSAYIPTDGHGGPPIVSPWDQTGWDISHEAILRFYVLRTTGDEVFSVRLIDIDGYGGALVDASNYMRDVTVWQLVSIPVGDLVNGPGADAQFDPTKVRFIAFANPSIETPTWTVYVDKVEFVPEPGTLVLAGLGALAILPALKRRSQQMGPRR